MVDKVKGYKKLTTEQIGAMNYVKNDLSNPIETFIGILSKDENVDPYALEQAVQYLKTGMMWLNRSIAKPDSWS